MKVSADVDEISISSEHDDYRWFTKKEVKELFEKNLLTKAAKNTLKKIEL